MRRMHTYIAATHTASSSRVHTSVMRISSVGKREDGRRSHQILLASSMTPLRTSRSTVWRVLLPALEAAGQAGARQLLVGGEAIALEAGVLAFGERRGGREHEQMRQEVARLVHEVDAQLVVLDADMHVHAADDEAAADAGEILGDAPGSARARWAAACSSARTGGWRRRWGPGRARRPARDGLAQAAASSAPAAAASVCTLVPTSICDFRNSRATWPPSACCAASNRPCGISRTRSRLARSTRRYSSSMPMVKVGSLRGMPPWWHESRETAGVRSGRGGRQTPSAPSKRLGRG